MVFIIVVEGKGRKRGFLRGRSMLVGQVQVAKTVALLRVERGV